MRKNDTKSAMKKALVQLLSKKRFLDITVTDVVRKAEVARASFYRSYNSIDEIIDEIFIDFKNRITEKTLPLVFSETEENIIQVLIDFYTSIKNKDLLFIDVLPENINLIMSKLDRLMVNATYRKFDNIFQKYTPFVNFSIIVSTARLWTMDGCKETPEEVANYTYQIIKNHRIK